MSYKLPNPKRAETTSKNESFFRQITNDDELREREVSFKGKANKEITGI